MAIFDFYQIDAFASKAFEGNQACVMPLDDWALSDATLQAIAAENNVAETAFIVKTGDAAWDLRWFTPAVEVPLCGHATLGAAHALVAEMGVDAQRITFQTRQSGQLSVASLGNNRYEMDFPASNIHALDIDETIATEMGARPIAMWGGSFCALQFETPDQVRDLTPNLAALKTLGAHGDGWARGNFGCFALGGEDGIDVTSRFFAPGSGIDEDPATGSWHCMLSPIVAELTGQTELACRQIYPSRGASVSTKLEGDRVRLIGQAVSVIRGQFVLEEA